MNGIIPIDGIGTIRWRITDDDGIVHEIIIENALFARKSPVKLLSPQHWSQSANDNIPKKRGTWCAQYDDEIVLYWDQEEYKKSVPYDKRQNVATFYSAPDFAKYRTHVAIKQHDDPINKKEFVAFRAVSGSARPVPEEWNHCKNRDDSLISKDEVYIDDNEFWSKEKINVSLNRNTTGHTNAPLKREFKRRSKDKNSKTTQGKYKNENLKSDNLPESLDREPDTDFFSQENCRPCYEETENPADDDQAELL